MRKLGTFLVALGIIGFIYWAVGMQLRILQWLEPQKQPLVCGGMVVVGLILAGIGWLAGGSSTAPAQPPPSPAPMTYAPGVPPPIPGSPPPQYAGYYGNPPPPAYAPSPPPGGAHHPGLAAAAAVLIPGAGQAYNGKPIRAFFLVVLLAVLAGLFIARAPGTLTGTFDIPSLQRSAQILLAAFGLLWLLSIAGAFLGAVRIRTMAGRTGRGGLFWVVLQLWLVANAVTFVAVGLTIGGVLR